MPQVPWDHSAPRVVRDGGLEDDTLHVIIAMFLELGLIEWADDAKRTILRECPLSQEQLAQFFCDQFLILHMKAVIPRLVREMGDSHCAHNASVLLRVIERISRHSGDLHVPLHVLEGEVPK